MSDQDRVYQVRDVVGSSPDGLDQAIAAGVRSVAPADGQAWFEVREVRGFVENGDVQAYQVMMTVGFTA